MGVTVVEGQEARLFCISINGKLFLCKSCAVSKIRVSWKSFYIFQNVFLAGCQWLFLYVTGVTLASEFLATYFIVTAVYVPVSSLIGVQVKNLIIINDSSSYNFGDFLSVRLSQTLAALFFTALLVFFLYDNFLTSVICLTLIAKSCEFFLDAFIGETLRNGEYQKGFIIILYKTLCYAFPAFLIFSGASGIYAFGLMSGSFFLATIILLASNHILINLNFKKFIIFSRKNYSLGVSQLANQGLFPTQRAIIGMYASSEFINAVGMATQCIISAQVIAVPLVQAGARRLSDVKKSLFENKIIRLFWATFFLSSFVCYVCQYFVMNSFLSGHEKNIGLTAIFVLAGGALGAGNLLNLLAIKKSLHFAIMQLNVFVFALVVVVMSLFDFYSLQAVISIIAIAIIFINLGLLILIKRHD